MPEERNATDVAQQQKEVKEGFLQRAKAWGDSSLPPACLATLIFPLHARPFQPLPMLFPPVLLGCSYLNLSGYTTDAAGISAAWSGLYMLLASRRKYRVMQKLSPPGLIRGAALALAAVNVATGGVSYTFGKGGRDEHWIGKGKD